MKKDRRQPTISAKPDSPEATELRRALFSARSEWRGPKIEASRRYLGMSPRAKYLVSRDQLPSCSCHLLGVGLAEKISERKYCEEPAITFLVTRKVAKSKLTRKERLPKSIDGYPTDVISIGQPRLAQGSVVQAGSAINVQGRFPGTLGAFMVDQAGQRYAITNGHVVANQLKNPAYSPPAGTAGQQAIGVVQKAITPMPGVVNELDLAVVAVDPQAQLNPLLPGIGQIQGFAAPNAQQMVRMHGQASQNIFGWFFGSKVDTLIPIGGAQYGFREVYIFWRQGAGSFGQPGDSGSVIVDDNSQAAIGMLFSVAGGFGFAIPMARIAAKLQGLRFL
jgi:hypothetical protein